MSTMLLDFNGRTKTGVPEIMSSCAQIFLDTFEDKKKRRSVMSDDLVLNTVLRNEFSTGVQQ